MFWRFGSSFVLFVGVFLADEPRLHTVELFPEDYASSTFEFRIWVRPDGINKVKGAYILEFRDGLADSRDAPIIGSKRLRRNKLNFVLSKDQAKQLSQELELPNWFELYSLTFKVEKERWLGNYPVARIVSLKKVTK